MGKLNIAHHKSYHPYRRDNIERVRRDEEEARRRAAGEEGRMMLADSEARMDLLRQRAGLGSGSKGKAKKDDMAALDAALAGGAPSASADEPGATPTPVSTLTSASGHINLFEDLERQLIPVLEALEKFIQSQKALLERTHADIERLKELRRNVEVDPPQTLEELSDKLNDPSFRLSEQVDAMPPLPQEIDWSLFKGADPTPFKCMAATAREAYESRNVPPKAPLNPPSDLRKLVAQSRMSILDPVLSTFRLPDELALLSDDEPDPEELARAREREKIRELKKRKIEGDAAAPVFAGLGLRRPAAAHGVFIRQDQEDESAEVDMSMADEEAASRRAAGADMEGVPMDVDVTASASSPIVSKDPAPVKPEHGTERRSSRKVRTEPKGATAKAKDANKPQAKAKAKAETPEDSPEPSAGPPRDKNGKAKSETYKQAWSVSEQHLLERLLEEIPEGEKNRWSKISKAMNGRRTARQVASRVQKYYEKLKRFGVGVGNSSSKAGGGAIHHIS
ncbi:hypothetical protein BN946_scf184962.g68 [Trametes cinnabarina]|uniref:Uncharacterized protein n=1 Tax=Pycnoporus cinnabarinus TaxID=5643 RepID=A0A060SCN8_PYCCI|nr:hypothetical protein BN946_scf184962.g68 [Trametes cinnabarina]